MDALDHMRQAIAYIENHLDGELDYKIIAEKAACSQYHFQRMFVFLTGVPLSEYIRRRRLTLAAFELQNSRERVLDTAIRYGYNSPDSFTRAFHQLHGITPTEARKKGARLKAYPPITFTISLQGVTEMNYRITEKPALRLVGLKQRLPQTTLNVEVGRMWSSLTPEIMTQLSDLAETAPLELLGAYSEMYDDNSTDYHIGVFTSKEYPQEDLVQMKELLIPSCTWVIFEIEGPLPEAMAQVWGRIFTEWFPTSGYEHAQAPEIEWYSGGDMSATDYKSEIWIPIVKCRKSR